MSSVRPSNSGCRRIVGRASLTLTFVLSQLSARIPSWMDESVYGGSLVILLKYFGADLQMRNAKFERTILVNLRLAVLDLGRGFQC